MAHKSRYDSIWIAIKEDRERSHPEGVSVSALPKFHFRIIKAVTKRKDKDLAYKFVKAEAGFPPPKLSYTINQSIITFKLYYNKTLELL